MSKMTKRQNGGKNKMSKKVEVKSMKIKIGEREIELTTPEARDLYNELGKLFETRTITVPSPVIIERDKWPQPWDRPIWVDDNVTKPIVTWKSNMADITCYCEDIT